MGIILSFPLGKVGNFVAYEKICHGFVFRFSWRSDKMGWLDIHPLISINDSAAKPILLHTPEGGGKPSKIQYRYVSQQGKD
jgi:hypothetical protein